MVLKNFLAKLGHGGAKVDLILDKQEYVLDEQVSGELVIQGGTVEQHINKIDIELVMSLYYKNHHYTQTVQVFPFHTPFNIQPSEKKVFPFSCKIPSNLLLSSHSVSYYFITHLDIAGAVDHTDRDYVKILPPARLQNLLKAFEQIGFYEKHDS
ncbi:sporulation protein, partial [Thermoflavimicrobium dichotomicum]